MECLQSLFKNVDPESWGTSFWSYQGKFESLTSVFRMAMDVQ